MNDLKCVLKTSYDESVKITIRILGKSSFSFKLDDT